MVEVVIFQNLMLSPLSGKRIEGFLLASPRPSPKEREAELSFPSKQNLKTFYSHLIL
jgi:hypothetical protein